MLLATLYQQHLAYTWQHCLATKGEKSLKAENDCQEKSYYCLDYSCSDEIVEQN
jgi:hypothetical protein